MTCNGGGGGSYNGGTNQVNTPGLGDRITERHPNGNTDRYAD